MNIAEISVSFRVFRMKYYKRSGSVHSGRTRKVDSEVARYCMEKRSQEFEMAQRFLQAVSTEKYSDANDIKEHEGFRFNLDNEWVEDHVEYQEEQYVSINRNDMFPKKKETLLKM